jgi:hypothetical protein
MGGLLIHLRNPEILNETKASDRVRGKETRLKAGGE